MVLCVIKPYGTMYNPEEGKNNLLSNYRRKTAMKGKLLMKKHILNFVNNERTNVRVTSKKGYDRCINGAYDYCPSYSEDLGICSNYAYDECSVKDKAACSNGGDDICTIDLGSDGCQAPGTRDIG